MKQSQSVINERRNHIMRALAQNSDMRVSDLSRMLSVSEPTIRRDLNALAKEGLLYRTFGGAAFDMESAPTLPLYEDKYLIRQQQKRDIAVYIAGLIKDGDTIFLNGGTTTIEIINLIADKNVVIVTNNARASSLMRNSKATLISTGGEFCERNQSYTGMLAIPLIEKINANICVLGVNGISIEEGITSSNYMESLINNEMLRRCRGKVIIAADSSKVGKIYNFSTAPLSSIDLLVTDNGISQQTLSSFREQGLEIALAGTISIGFNRK